MNIDTEYVERLQNIESKPAVHSALSSTGCITLWSCSFLIDVTHGHRQISNANNLGKNRNPVFNFAF